MTLWTLNTKYINLAKLPEPNFTVTPWEKNGDKYHCEIMSSDPDMLEAIIEWEEQKNI